MPLWTPKRPVHLALAALGGLMLAVQAAAGAPLDNEACARLKDEEAQLAKSGAKSNLERGVVWAKANLPPEKLKEVEHYIELQEQILFRCPQPKPPPETAEKEDSAPAAPAKAKRPVAKAATSTQAEQPAPAGPKGKGATPATNAATEKAPPAKKSAAKPKPKPNDAYSPPPPKAGDL